MDEARLFATLGTIGIAAGGAAFVTGLVLHFTAPKTSVSVMPVTDGRALGLATRFSM